MDDVRSPKTLELAARSDAERIEYIRRDKWISYGAAVRVLDDLELLLSHPKRARMPCRLIVADTNNGKTNLIQRFMSLHQPDTNVAGEAVSVPVLRIEASGPDERALYQAILEALFEKYHPRATKIDLRKQCIQVLSRVQPGVLIIDEFNTLVNGTVLKTRDCLNGIKNVTNETRLPIVGAGTREALIAVQKDPQIENRFEPLWLPSWTYNKEFRALLAGFEAVTPLRKPSHLSSPELSRLVFDRSDKTIGEVAKQLERAAVYAISSGVESIDAQVLLRCGYRSPAERAMAFSH